MKGGEKERLYFISWQEYKALTLLFILEEGQMNQIKQGMKLLSKPVDCYLIFKPRMIGHPDLDFLRNFAVNGKVRVNVVGFNDFPHGRILCFTAKQAPGAERFALIDNFDFAISAKLSEPLKRLLSL